MLEKGVIENHTVPEEAVHAGCGYSVGVSINETVDIASTLYWDRWEQGVVKHTEGDGAQCFDFTGGVFSSRGLEYGPHGSLAAWAAMATYVNGREYAPVFW